MLWCYRIMVAADTVDDIQEQDSDEDLTEEAKGDTPILISIIV